MPEPIFSTMLSAHYVDPSEAPTDAGARGAAPEELIGDREYAAQRLSGTIWARGPGEPLYRAVLAAGRALARAGVSADGLTAASVVLAALAGMAAAVGAFVAAALLVLASGACDALDGVVARAQGRASRFGALLDSTVDRLSDGLPLLGIVVFYAGQGALVAVPAAAMMGAFTVSYIRARAEGLGAELPSLFMRRAERVSLLVVTLFVAPIELGPVVELRAPLLLGGVSLIGLLSYVGAWSALRSARVALSGPRVPHVSGTSE